MIGLLTSGSADAELLSSLSEEPMLGTHTDVLPSAMTYNGNDIKLLKLHDTFKTVTCC